MFPGLSADSAGKDTVVLQVNILMSSTNDLEWSTVLPIVPNSGALLLALIHIPEQLA